MAVIYSCVEYILTRWMKYFNLLTHPEGEKKKSQPIGKLDYRQRTFNIDTKDNC